MKRTTKTSVAVLLMAAIIGSQPLMLLAQSNDPSSPVQTDSATNINAAEVVVTTGTTVSTEPAANQHAKNRRGRVVGIFTDATGPADASAESVVSIGGSARATGAVRKAVVAIGGDAHAGNEVGDAVVSLGGNAVARAKVGDAVVAVAGNAEADGEVGDAVVAVMGNVKLGSNAVVNGDVVAVGGKIEMADGAQVKGEIREISVAQYPMLLPLKGAADWLRHCPLKLRLLAPQPGWYWLVAGVFLLLYLLIAVAAPRPVKACVTELSQRPATTFLMGLLVKILLPVVLVVLVATGIGAVVVPFVLVAALIGGLIGKAALFECLGVKLFKMFGVTVGRPVLALLAGFALVTLFYMVPLISLMVYWLLGLWAIGVATMAGLGGMKRESPPQGATGIPYMPAADVAGETAGGVPPSVANMPEAHTLQRANFWERVGAAFLDIIIVGILSALVGGLPQGGLVALAYFAGMWMWKGTTIGGTVFSLKVVRLDGQPVTFGVALVRGLVAVLSALVFCIGFLWMIWDRDRQTWHDKVAGTVVVRTPRVTPLVCL